MTRNRLDTADPTITELTTLDQALAATRDPIQRHIDHHPDLKQRRDWLESIPAIGPAASAYRLTALSARQASRRPCQPGAQNPSVRPMGRQNPHRQNR